MLKLFIIHGIVPIGCFESAAQANQAIRHLDEKDITRVSSAHILEEVFSEPELRAIRGALRVLKDVQAGKMKSSNIDSDAKLRRDLDEDLKTRIKDKQKAATLCWDELSAFKFQTPTTPKEQPMTSKTEKKPRVAGPSAKAHLRELFDSVGKRATLDEMSKGGIFTDGAVTTAVSDLKNEKYAAGPIVVLKREKDEAGNVTYVREA